MNKINKLIGSLLLSAFMLVGVGVSVDGKEAIRGDASVNSYEKVSSLNDGDKILITSVKNNVNYYIPTNNGNTKAPTASSINIANNTIAGDYDANLFTLEADGANWKFNSAAGYLYTTSTNNGVRIGTNTNNSFKVTTTTNGFKMQNVGTKRYIGIYNTQDWRCYQTSNASNYGGSGEAINFYKVKVAISESPLSSITLSGQKTEYYVNDKFSFTGTCTATYEDGTSKEVTPTKISAIDMTTPGTKTVELSYTEGDRTRTASYDINVKEFAYVGDGTLENPFNISDAIRKANEFGSTGSTETYFVKGKVKEITTQYNSQHGNVSFTLTDDSTTDVFKAYRCLADDGVKFASDPASLLTTGTEVVVCGIIKEYNGEPELDANCYLYDYKATSITSTEPLKTDYKVGDEVTIANLGISVNASIEVTGESRNVTNECEIVNGLPLVKGDNTLTISYAQTNKYSGKKSTTPITTTIVVKDVKQTATSITINAPQTKVNIGESIALTATVLPEDTFDKTVTWTSENEEIATVVDGVVTGVKVGKVNIIAKCGTVSNFVEIEVKDPSIVLDSIHVKGEFTKTEYFVGETFDPSGVTVNAFYSDLSIVDITNDVTWPETLDVANEAYLVKAKYTYVENGVTKTIEDKGSSIKVIEKVLEGLLVSDSFKTVYTTKDSELDMSGFAVEAGYVNSSRYFDVTDKVTIDGTIDFSKLGNQTITVSYTENGVTATEDIVITINLDMTIQLQDGSNKGFVKITENQTDWSGEYLIVYEGKDKNYAFNGLDATNGNYEVSIADGKIAKDESIAVTVTIAKMSSGDGYSMKVNGGTNDGKYMSGKSGSNTINFVTSEQKVTFEFAADDGHLQIMSNSTYFRFNSASNNMRFRFFKTESQNPVSLYKYSSGLTNYTVTEHLYTAIQEADAALVCGNSSNNWTGTYDVDTASEYINKLTEIEKNALKSAVADEHGNLVEQFLWKYDYLVSAGKIENFLGRSVTNNVKINSFLTNMSNDTTTSIIVIISLVSITSIGGYFFIRKRKEQ